MSGSQDAKRNGRRKRTLSAEEKYQIWQQLLTGELTQRQAAEQWNVDPTTIMRIRRIGREGALSALAQSRPGVRAGSGGAQDAELAAARAEIARLEETVKEQAIELVALRGKRARAGRPGPGARRGRGQARVARLDRADDPRRVELRAGLPDARPERAARALLAG